MSGRVDALLPGSHPRAVRITAYVNEPPGEMLERARLSLRPRPTHAEIAAAANELPGTPWPRSRPSNNEKTPDPCVSTLRRHAAALRVPGTEQPGFDLVLVMVPKGTRQVTVDIRDATDAAAALAELRAATKTPPTHAPSSGPVRQPRGRPKGPR